MLPGDQIRFDGWTLHRGTGELVRDGASVRLQSQPLQVLELLLAEPGRLVTREQLIARLWPGGVVDFDTALNSTVRRLRTALGDHPDQPRYIETIPRRGYRFIGRLDPPSAAGAPEVAATGPGRARGGRTGWLAVAAVLVAVVAAGTIVWTVRVPGGASGSANARAQESYQRARYFLQRRGRSDLDLARRYFDEAVSLDPDFAEAWVGVASAYMLSTFDEQLPMEQGLATVRNAAERALELDPTLAMAHVRLANYWGLLGERERAQEHVRVARELQPGDPIVQSIEASRLVEEGRFDEGVSWQRRAVELDPLSYSGRYNLATYLFISGRLIEAEAELDRLRELHPDRRDPTELHGVLLLATGRYAAALDLANGWNEGFDRDFISAVALDGLGRHDESDATLRRMIETRGRLEGFRIAEVYAHRGDVDESLRWLDSAVAAWREVGWRAFGRRPLWILAHWPLLQTVRQDPRWESWYAAALRPVRQANAGNRGRTPNSPK